MDYSKLTTTLKAYKKFTDKENNTSRYNVTLNVNETKSLRENISEAYDDITWASSDLSVLNVNNYGVVLGLKAGHSVVVATANNTVLAIFDISIN